MWAFITDSYKAIIPTQRELEFLIGIYPYASWRKITDVSDAKKFWASYERKFFKTDNIYLGTKDKVGYLKIEYFIANNNIYINVNTKHFGFTKLRTIPKNVIQEVTYDIIRLKVQNVVLNDELISHHCLAIYHILKLFSEFINIEIVLPDISVYLALTKYTGNNYNIKKAKNELDSRLGATYWTIKGENYD